MLSQIIFNICEILCCSYDELFKFSKEYFILDKYTESQIYLKKFFFHKWREKLNSPIKHKNFNYNYNILSEDKNYIKIHLKIRDSFVVDSCYLQIPSYTINDYLIILEHSKNTFKIKYIINREANEELYSKALNCNLSFINEILPFYLNTDWVDKIDSIDLLYENFIKHSAISNSPRNSENISKFDIPAACFYAEKFALSSNPEYKTFYETGGDCTNFVSQIVHAGGIKTNNIWKPYSNPWIRVQDFYWYIISNGLGINVPENYPLGKGYVIQFHTPQKNRFFHTGFITYELLNGDYLYCCHSYNKLNYPLSAIYPIIYPTLRSIKLK